MSARPLCVLADLEATGAKGVLVDAPSAALHIVVVRDGAQVRAYRNECPHLGMPLEILADHFLDETGDHLVCRTHGARFSVRDGYCISGPCRGGWLKALEIAVVDGTVLLAGSNR